jgi:hypothetical protein|uniref:Uncharacterized protein n=1 Tax=viral metagenome TaxID=1070528 RepID=A0A6C0BXZ6_9ZZZZ
MSNSQYLILNDGFKNIKNSLNKNHILMIYCNTFFSFSIFIILIVIASQLSPVVNDAGILINDASENLKDFSILIPRINNLIPEAQNTTRILGHLIPMIKNGMHQLRQLCHEAPGCY